MVLKETFKEDKSYVLMYNQMFKILRMFNLMNLKQILKMIWIICIWSEPRNRKIQFGYLKVNTVEMDRKEKLTNNNLILYSKKRERFRKKTVSNQKTCHKIHMHLLPIVNVVSEFPGAKASDSLNVIFPGMSISKRWTYYAVHNI